ncbi:MAG: hypothetical protein AB7S70_09555 [Hyphomicrobium sp.]|uniref:hypothetical protein n=1 Tax=Hyphomicrobium sp. TaxID=82 RepID=UPI003D129B87
MLLRPLPPFRAKPMRRPMTPKSPAEGRKNGSTAVTVKAHRHPVKFARLERTPALKVLSREAT